MYGLYKILCYWESKQQNVGFYWSLVQSQFDKMGIMLPYAIVTCDIKSSVIIKIVIVPKLPFSNLQIY